MNEPIAPTLHRLKTLTADSVAEISALALVIGSADEDQRHVGILHRDPDDIDAPLELLDLQWHHILKSVPPELPSQYLWSSLAVAPEASYVLARRCKLIADKYARGGRRLGYALRYTGEAFDPAGEIPMTEDGSGLTCATFVMAVFESSGVSLLRWTEWPVREEDRAWQDRIVGFLRRTRTATSAHVAAVNEQAERGCARFRPEEVAAASVWDTLPLGFADAERIGRLIVERVSPQAPDAP